MCTKLQIFVLETKVWWKIESESERVNENMELKLRNFKGYLDHQQEMIDQLESNQEKSNKKIEAFNSKVQNISEDLSIQQQSINVIGAKVTESNDDFKNQSKLFTNFKFFIKVLIWSLLNWRETASKLLRDGDKELGHCQYCQSDG